MSFLSPNRVRTRKGRSITYRDLAHHKLTCGFSTLFLTTEGSRLPWRRIVKPLVSPLMPNLLTSSDLRKRWPVEQNLKAVVVVEVPVTVWPVRLCAVDRRRTWAAFRAAVFPSCAFPLWSRDCAAASRARRPPGCLWCRVLTSRWRARSWRHDDVPIADVTMTCRALTSWWPAHCRRHDDVQSADVTMTCWLVTSRWRAHCWRHDGVLSADVTMTCPLLTSRWRAERWRHDDGPIADVTMTCWVVTSRWPAKCWRHDDVPIADVTMTGSSSNSIAPTDTA